MNNVKYWNERNNRVISKIGYWKSGEDVIVEGKSLINDIMKNSSYMQLLILNATGKFVEKNIADWIEISFMGLSYPDARIWCNQLSAFAADTNCSPTTSVSACIMGADSRAYGGSKTRIITMKFLIDAYKKFTINNSFEDIMKDVKFANGKPIIIGFVRPVSANDERIPAYIREQKRLNIKRGKMLSFAFMLNDYLFDKYGFSINIAGYSGAFYLDQGFSPMEAYRLCSFSTAAGAVACNREFAELPPNSFTPLKCDDIHYIGPQKRNLDNN